MNKRGLTPLRATLEILLFLVGIFLGYAAYAINQIMVIGDVPQNINSIINLFAGNKLILTIILAIISIAIIIRFILLVGRARK